MENKKYNEITAQDLDCIDGDKFVVQCNFTDYKEFTDYATALKFLNEHLKVLHFEDSVIQLVKRIPVKVHELEIGIIDVPILVYNLYLQGIENPKKEADKVWNEYVASIFKNGENSKESFNLRNKFFDLVEGS